MEILGESAIRVTLLAAGVAIVLRLLRIRSPRLAHAAWTAVLLTMLVMPLFVAWMPQVGMPIMPANAVHVTLDPAAGDAAAPDPARIETAAASAASPQRWITWGAAVAAIYAAGVVLMLVRLAVGLRHAQVIRRTAVRRHGRLVHPGCVTPIAIGIVTPEAVLPSDWESWDAVELAAVLAHEEEHVRRRDPLVAAVALVNRAIFWFHPLAWWLQREIGRLAEQACDAAVIASGHDRAIYSASLLRFARRAAGAGGRITPLATAIEGAGLHERLLMLTRPLPPPLSRWRIACVSFAGAALVVVCAAAAPVQNTPVVSPAGWSVHTSDHFDIWHQGIPAEGLMQVAREAEAAYAQLSAALKYDTAARVAIVLVQRDRDLAATGTQAPAALAPGRQRVVISLESLNRGTGIIVHELTHQFAFEILPGTSRVVPVLVEGLAEHQRGAWTADDLRLTRDAAAAGAIPLVESLVDSDRHWAHALFDFVAEQQGEEGIRRLIFALRAHYTLPAAIPMALGLSLDTFNQGFRGYVAARFGQP